MDFRRLKVVLFDTSACIYFLDRVAGGDRHAVVAPIVRAAERRRLRIVLSPVSVAELLVKPLREDDVVAEAHIRLFAEELCEVSPLTTSVAATAALLRARHRLAMPDALILATAVAAGADAVVGNDAAWRAVPGVAYRHIDDHV